MCVPLISYHWPSLANIYLKICFHNLTFMVRYYLRDNYSTIVNFVSLLYALYGEMFLLMIVHSIETSLFCNLVIIESIVTVTISYFLLVSSYSQTAAESSVFYCQCMNRNCSTGLPPLTAPLCQVYQRNDLNRIVLSQSVGPSCNLQQTVYAKSLAEGAAVSLSLVEYERERE